MSGNKNTKAQEELAYCTKSCEKSLSELGPRLARRSTHISNNIIPLSLLGAVGKKARNVKLQKKLSDSAAAFDVAIKLNFKVNIELFKDAVALKSGDKI